MSLDRLRRPLMSCLLAWSAASQAQTLVPLGDLNTEPESSRPGNLSWPSQFGNTPSLVHEGVFYFPAEGPWGNELYRTDGGSASLVVDAVPGPRGGLVGQFRARGSQVFFVSAPGFNVPGDTTLWVTGGTQAGATALLRLTDGSRLRLLDFNGGELGFLRERSRSFPDGGVEQLRQLWLTDGTLTGTREIVSASVVPPFYSSSFSGGQFYTTDGSPPLSRTDLATGVTTPVQLPLQPACVGATGLTPLGNDLVFVCWGNTPSLTYSLASLHADGGAEYLHPELTGAIVGFGERLPVSGGRIWFYARDADAGAELHVTGGTAASTQVAVDAWPGPGDGLSSSPEPPVVNDGWVPWLSADSSRPFGTLLQGVNALDGGRLTVPYPLGFWPSVWQTSTTTFVLPPRSSSGLPHTILTDGGFAAVPSSSRYSVSAVLGEFLLTGGTTDAGEELVKSDGITTTLVADLAPGSRSSLPGRDAGVTRVGNSVVFWATTSATGAEPWATDGTPGGARLLLDVLPGPASSLLGELSRVTLGQRMLFTTGGRVYSTDGTVAGTQLLPGDSNNTLFMADGWAWWAGTDLMRSDGTVAGTSVARTSAQGFWLYGAAGTTLYFVEGSVLKSYRTGQSPVALPGDPILFDRNVCPLSNGLLFTSRDAVGFQDELWVTDGSPTGTRQLAAGSVQNVICEPGGAWFTAANALWRTTGSTPVRVLTLTNHGWVPMGNPPYRFFARTDGQQLLATDGTAAGTRVVFDGAGIAPTLSASLGNLLFFSTPTTTEGAELMRSDGTAAGTVLLREFFAGPGAGLVSFEGTWNGRLLFVAYDPALGPELWSTDGTVMGTQLVLDGLPGSAGASPWVLSQLSTNRLLVSALDATGDREPAVLEFPVDAGVDAGVADAGSHVDAGSSDAGTGVDAGSRVDAGAGVDAGSRIDAGAGVDAGPADAGDAGQLVFEDAGMSVDAGTGNTPAQTGCGCASTNATSLWALWVGLALLARRHRRAVAV
ncbi:MAG: hypothetical protein Q8L14_30535 [Myxococcales bacterium]|nr:hypothetical protein [Myxococcales bacterium]